jgi:hypothetical protein
MLIVVRRLFENMEISPTDASIGVLRFSNAPLPNTCDGHRCGVILRLGGVVP